MLTRQVKKIGIVILACWQVLVLIGCSNERYPMTYYDKDLMLEDRESIRDAYDNNKFEKQQSKFNRNNNSSDDSLRNQTANVDDDYVAYEKYLYEDKTSIYNVNLSITAIDGSYKYKVINKNVPDFDIKDYDGKTFEQYSELDSLGRCGVAFALLGEETMPAPGEERESIGMIKPSGWQTPQNKYDFIDGKFLYNRCHLIGWQLSAENSNEKNLITGTRYLNTKGMLPYENQVANYIRNTHNHVLYRVTPIFEGSNLLASRVQIEAMSYEDNGAGIKFNVLLENYEPNVHIDYATGANWEEKGKGDNV